MSLTYLYILFKDASDECFKFLNLKYMKCHYCNNCGVSEYSILFKSNDDNITSIIGKIYKKDNYLANKTSFDLNKYDKITEKGISSRFITIYNIRNDYNFKTTLYNVIDDNSYNNFIDLYEVGGFMTILNYIIFSNEFNVIK